MIGAWQIFGEGEPPADGEALVFIRQIGVDIIDAMEGASGAEAVVAVHRVGTLYERNGSTGGIPLGCWWTSIPPPPVPEPRIPYFGPRFGPLGGS